MVAKFSLAQFLNFYFLQGELFSVEDLFKSVNFLSFLAFFKYKSRLALPQFEFTIYS